MRIISPRVHGALDYLVGALLMFAPELFGFADTPGVAVPLIRSFGAVAVLYSLFTKYELGIVRLIPFGTHLRIDIGWGMLLAASPWLLGFAEQGAQVWGVAVAVGLAGMLIPCVSVPLRRELTTQVPQKA